jgi:Ca-activated chloride channel homolog
LANPALPRAGPPWSPRPFEPETRRRLPDYTGNVLRGLRVIPCLLAVSLAIPIASGSPGQVFKSGVDLVVVQATVKDRDGRLISGLGVDDFRLYEDGVEQRISQFTGERVPVSLGIAVDVSDSMFGVRIADARRAIDRFVLTLLDEDDEAFLMVFNHAPLIKAQWTRPPKALAGHLDAVKPFGGTAIYDALIKAVPMFEKRRHERCGLVLISDGADTASDARLQDALRRLNLSDAFVFGIAIDAPSGPAINHGFSPEALNEIASQTGGYTEVIRDSAELGGATERIASELNHQYTLAYAPARQPDGQYHSIRVRTKNESYTVRSRRGFTHLRTRTAPAAR